MPQSITDQARLHKSTGRSKDTSRADQSRARSLLVSLLPCLPMVYSHQQQQTTRSIKSNTTNSIMSTTGQEHVMACDHAAATAIHRVTLFSTPPKMRGECDTSSAYWRRTLAIGSVLICAAFMVWKMRLCLSPDVHIQGPWIRHVQRKRKRETRRLLRGTQTLVENGLDAVVFDAAADIAAAVEPMQQHQQQQTQAQTQTQSDQR